MEWVDISVFISSTFNDMHAERDLLLKKVFPALSEWCAERKIRIYDIDLRWGVTAEDSKNKNTVEVCLRNIDNCRPFFLCFLGQRRGWVPSKDVVSQNTYDHYPEIKQLVGNHSVTEMEIEHALLSPMISLVEGRSTRPQAAEHSLFFIRDGSYTEYLNSGQRNIFTNADSGDEAKTDEEQASFIARVKNEWTGVYDYSCRFDKGLYSSELKTFGEDVAQGRLTDFYIKDTPLDAFILESLKREIIKAYPERSEADSIHQYDNENDRQERRALDMIQGTITREGIMKRIGAYGTAPDGRTFVLYGKAGSGKSTLLSQYFEKYKSEYDNSILRFCGSTSGTSSWTDLWNDIQEELLSGDNYDSSSADGLLKLLKEISKKGSTLIIVDGIDELKEGLTVLPAIPDRLPDGVRLILSFRIEAARTKELVEELGRNGKAELCEIAPLSEKSEIEKLISLYLSRYLKALDDEQIDAICENPSSHNPLFLKIILRELRVFGSYGQIGDQIRAYGDDPESAFIKTLNDLENEIDYAGVSPEVFVPHMMGVLALIRGSISIRLLKLCLTKLIDDGDEKVADTLSFYQRRLGPYFFWDGEHLGISYASLREGARGRYAEFAEIHHSILAEAFRNSDPLESLYHLRMAGRTEEIYRLSEDISFLMGAIKHSGALRLLSEIEAAVISFPSCVSEEILSCLRKTAALIGKDVQRAAALFYKELENESMQEQAALICIKPWIRYERLPFEVPASTDDSNYETLFSLDNTECQGFCTAEKQRLVYLLKGERDIEIYCLNDGMAGASFSLQEKGRIRKIECSPDGRLLAAAAEDLTVSVYSVALDEAMRLLMLTKVYHDQCASIRFGGISLFSGTNGIIWQRPDGGVIYYTGSGNQISEERAEGKQLAGVNACGTVWKAGRSYSLSMHSGSEIASVEARINDAVTIDGFCFLATENKRIGVYDVKTGTQVKEYQLPGESLISLAVIGETVYGADRYGALVRVQKESVDDLGRITQGEDILDVNTRLIALSEARMAFVSMQRRAVILLSESLRQEMRLMRVCTGKSGNALIWDGRKEFTVTLEDGGSRRIAYPKLLLEGRNVNEKNILKIACAGETMVYEENRVGIHFISADRIIDINEEPASEMGGILCDIQYARESALFPATTYKGEFLEIDMSGNICTRLELPCSTNNLHHLCVCGKNCAVLSRAVQKRENGAVSAYFADVLTMIQDGNIVWQKTCDRDINKMLYDSSKKLLALFNSKNYLELIAPDTGCVTQKYDFPTSGFDEGAAVFDGRIYYVGFGDYGHQLTIRYIDNSRMMSLPSQRRVKQIYNSGREVFVQEGNELLYKIELIE